MRYHANGIEYEFKEMEDGWIAIYEIDYYKGRIPIIQAKTLELAKSYCILREPVTVPMTPI